MDGMKRRGPDTWQSRCRLEAQALHGAGCQDLQRHCATAPASPPSLWHLHHLVPRHDNASEDCSRRSNVAGAVQELETGNETGNEVFFLRLPTLGVCAKEAAAVDSVAHGQVRVQGSENFHFTSQPTRRPHSTQHTAKRSSSSCLRVCVCVCVQPCDPRENLFHIFACSQVSMQGSVALTSYHTQRSCGCKWEARPDQSCVPAKQNGRHGLLIVQLVANFCGRFYMSGRHSHVQTCQCNCKRIHAEPSWHEA